MKWIFLAFLLIFTPALSSWLKANPGKRPLVYMLLGFLPFVSSAWNLEAAPVAWPFWPGHTRGIEIGLIDAVAVAILSTAKRRRYKLPIIGFFAAYVGAVLLAIPQAGANWMASLFYGWLLIRVCLVFVAVVSICEDERAPIAIVKGMVAGVGVQACYAVYAYATGAIQTGGAFGHQNLLGMVTHFAAYPALAVLLYSKKGWVPAAGVLLGLLIPVLSASRATIGLAGVGYALTIIFSCSRRMTPRKGFMAFLALIAVAGAAPLALMSLERRYQVQGVPDVGYDERAAFSKAAWMILHDNPLGVGANQYVVVANVQGYSQRAGVVWNPGSRATHVHNSYLLAAAETGWLGMVTLSLLLLRGLWIAFVGAFRSRKDVRGEILLGFGVALLMTCLHAFYEWMMMVSSVFYLIGINLGVIGGVAVQTGYWKKGRGAKAQEASAAPGAKPASTA